MSAAPPADRTPATQDAAAIAAVGRLSSVASILEVCCRVTGMGFAAVARVTPEEWTACAVLDHIGFGLAPGGQLPVDTTICHEIRQSRQVVAFDDAAADEHWAAHPTPRLYGLRSYISVPILRRDGSMFGTLCAIDPQPHPVTRPETVTMFELFAQLIAGQLDAEDRMAAADVLHRDTEAQLARSEAALLDEQAVSELREQFIAVLGHDLRNPVAAISAGATLLDRAELDPRSRRVVAQIKASTARMGRLINNVLDFARGRLGGGLPIGPRLAVDLGPVMDQIVEEMRAAHPERTLQVDLALDRPVACDPDRLAQMMANLLSNAVHHGKGDVRLGGGFDDEGLRLWVANAGAPIPEAYRERLFEPFKRHGDSEGLGLGLYIAAQIAQAHGGGLTLDSDAAETRFTFRMPHA